MSNLVFFVPACGEGRRTSQYGQHKPFIKLGRRTMLQHVLDQVAHLRGAVDIHVALRTDMGCCPLDREATVHLYAASDGQLDTVRRWLAVLRLGAGQLVWQNTWLLISNCDNTIGMGGINVMRAAKQRASSMDGFIATISEDPKAGDVRKLEHRFSYVHVDQHGWATKVTEKHDPTDQAVAGVYLLRASVFAEAVSATPPTMHNLSDALNNMAGNVLPVRIPNEYYEGWNDVAQIEDWKSRFETHTA